MADDKPLDSFDDFSKGYLKDSADLAAQIRKAVSRPMSREELREQKLNFVTGMLPRGCSMTRKDVADLLDKTYG